MALSIVGTPKTLSINSANTAINVPTGIQKGDLVLLWIVYSTGTLNVPTGGTTFNTYGNLALAGATGTIAAKIAGSSEPGTYGITFSSGTPDIAAICVVYRGHAVTSTASATSPGFLDQLIGSTTNSASTNITGVTQTSSRKGDQMILFYNTPSNPTITAPPSNPAAFTKQVQVSSPSNLCTACLCDCVDPNVGATGVPVGTQTISQISGVQTLLVPSSFDQGATIDVSPREDLISPADGSFQTTGHYRTAATSRDDMWAETINDFAIGAAIVPAPPVPSTPTGLGATPTDTTLALSWSASTDASYSAGVLVYEIQYVAHGGSLPGYAQFVTAPGTTSYTLTGLTPGTSYDVQVRARDPFSEVSPWTSTLTTSTSADTTAPTFVGVGEITGSRRAVHLSWKAASDDVTATGSLTYKVYRATSSHGQNFASPLATTPAGQCWYDDTVPDTDNVTYYYVVRAFDGAGNGDTNTTELSYAISALTFGGVGEITGNRRAVHLSWSPGSSGVDATSSLTYSVFRSTTSGSFNYASPLASGITTTYYDDTVPDTDNVTYYYVVRAVDSSGANDGNTSQLSYAISALTFAGLAEAKLVGANGSHLAWSPASSGVDATSSIVYDVFRATTSGGQNFASPLASGVSATYYDDTGLADGTTYYYVVRARDSSGANDGNTTERTVTVGDITAPTTPTGLGLVANSSQQITASWSASTDNVTSPSAIEYLLEVRTASPGGAFSPTHSAYGTTSLRLIGLTANTTYYVRIAAKDAAGNVSAASAIVNATTSTDTPTFAGLQYADARSTTSVLLAWNPGSDPDGEAIQYKIFRATTSHGQNFASPLATVTGSTTYLDSTVSPATTYYYVVRASDGSTTETNTTEVSVTTPASVDVTPPTFAGITALNTPTVHSLVAHWAAATDDQTPQGSIVYDVHVSTSPGAPFATYQTSAPGATSHTITGLAPATTYYVKVRARDTTGNEDSNTVELSAATSADTTAPTFAGATAAYWIGSGQALVVWSPATDNVSAQSAIVYDVFLASTSGFENFAGSPSATSAAGAMSIALSLSPGTYYVVVRARDEAGNRDTNVVERSFVVPAVDATPPTVDSFTPAAGTSVGPNDALGFDVADASGFRDVIVLVSFDGSPLYEVVYDGQSFAPRYAASSEKTQLSVPGVTKYRFSVVRTGGWPASPTFRIHAVDTAGNEG